MPRSFVRFCLTSVGLGLLFGLGRNKQMDRERYIDGVKTSECESGTKKDPCGAGVGAWTWTGLGSSDWVFFILGENGIHCLISGRILAGGVRHTWMVRLGGFRRKCFVLGLSNLSVLHRLPTKQWSLLYEYRRCLLQTHYNPSYSAALSTVQP